MNTEPKTRRVSLVKHPRLITPSMPVPTTEDELRDEQTEGYFESVFAAVRRLATGGDDPEALIDALKFLGELNTADGLAFLPTYALGHWDRSYGLLATNGEPWPVVRLRISKMTPLEVKEIKNNIVSLLRAVIVKGLSQ